MLYLIEKKTKNYFWEIQSVWIIRQYRIGKTIAEMLIKAFWQVWSKIIYFYKSKTALNIYEIPLHRIIKNTKLMRIPYVLNKEIFDYSSNPKINKKSANTNDKRTNAIKKVKFDEIVFFMCK